MVDDSWIRFAHPQAGITPFMLKAYIDDSCIGHTPVSVLAGWVAAAATWDAFSDEWKEALEMKPRLNYFKMSEANSFTGEFSGWSEQSRNERMRLLVRIIADYQPLGVASAIPHDLYKRVFGSNPDKAIAHPYFISFYGLIAHVMEYLAAQGTKEKVNFIFDTQDDQMNIVMASWKRFVSVSPPEVQAILGDQPIFRNDKTTVPLQAADLSAGWLRSQAADSLLGKPNRDPIWGDKADRLRCIGRLWSLEDIMKIKNRAEARKRAGLA
jgi:hypothetical protein